MNLIFNDYINFLEDKGLKYKLEEGYYWLDKSIIKAFDKNGNIHKILRLYINDNLDITFKEYDNIPDDVESWTETVLRNKERLIELESNSQSLIHQYIQQYNDRTIAVLSSGGKDSSVVTHLVKSQVQEPLIIFNNTTLDCADTYVHIKKENNLKIITPKEGFYQWRKRHNFIPTRFARACCNIFKEGAMVDELNKNDKYLFCMGMRNDESATRSKYGDEWKNEKWGHREWDAILPIRQWTEVDIWLYILFRNIDINPKYKKGYSRVGCGIACPYYTKSTWMLDKYWYPIMYNRWHDILDEDFNKNNKDIIMNCTNKEYHICWNGGVYRTEPTDDVIDNFAARNQINTEVAKRYFNHTCECCGKRIKNKEVLAMNMKYLGRNTIKFYCQKDLMQILSDMYNKPFTKENWYSDVERFKEQGCSLF